MFYQENAENVLQLATVVCSHSHIADVDITVVLEHGVDVPGVQLHQIIPRANIGDTAGAEEVYILRSQAILILYFLKWAFVQHFLKICTLS